MRYLFLSMFLLCHSLAYGQVSTRFKLEEITQITDGAFGVKKLYFNLACNQEFLRNLTEPFDGNSSRIGILTKFRERDCNEPSRLEFSRTSPTGRSLIPVTHFSEVWFCEGTCFTPGGPDMPPYNRFVESYGTSEKQATELLGCSEPYLQHLRCAPIDTSNP